MFLQHKMWFSTTLAWPLPSWFYLEPDNIPFDIWTRESINHTHLKENIYIVKTVCLPHFLTCDEIFFFKKLPSDTKARNSYYTNAYFSSFSIPAMLFLDSNDFLDILIFNSVSFPFLQLQPYMTVLPTQAPGSSGQLVWWLERTPPASLTHTHQPKSRIQPCEMGKNISLGGWVLFHCEEKKLVVCINCFNWFPKPAASVNLELIRAL